MERRRACEGAAATAAEDADGSTAPSATASPALALDGVRRHEIAHADGDHHGGDGDVGEDVATRELHGGLLCIGGRVSAPAGTPAQRRRAAAVAHRP